MPRAQWVNTMADFIVRPASDGDFEAVVQMINALMSYQGLEGNVPVNAEKLKADTLGCGHPRVIVAQAGDELIGYALYFSTYSSRYGRKCRYIEDIFVYEEHRRAGVGRALMEYIFGEAAAEGCLRVEWSCLDANDNARRFYLSLGAVPLDEWTVFRKQL